MNIINVAFQSVAVLLIIGLLGFWIIKRNILPQNILQILGVLAIDIALPCIVFANIIMKFSPSSTHLWWQYPLWWLGFSFIAFILSILSMLISSKITRREFAISLFFQNGLFFPFVIITGIFGPTTSFVAELFIFIAFHPTLFFSTNHLFFDSKKTEQEVNINIKNGKTRLKWGRIFNPVLFSTLIALIFKLSGIDRYLPSFIIMATQMLGTMSIPLLMLIIGGSLYVDFQNRGKIYSMEIFKFIIIKNILFPLVFIILLVLVRPSYSIALIIFLEGASPPITAIPFQTQKYGGNSSITNQFILSSFIFSIISIPLMFIIFNKYFPIH